MSRTAVQRVKPEDLTLSADTPENRTLREQVAEECNQSFRWKRTRTMLATAGLTEVAFAQKMLENTIAQSERQS